MFFFADLIHTVASEKDSGMKEMLCIMGVSFRLQWLAWWSRALVVFLPISFINTITLAFIYVSVGSGVIILLLLCYSLAITSLAFLIACWYVF